jgi:uncharacterized membrane protein YidH (DUF202 family)
LDFFVFVCGRLLAALGRACVGLYIVYAAIKTFQDGIEDWYKLIAPIDGSEVWSNFKNWAETAPQVVMVLAITCAIIFWVVCDRFRHQSKKEFEQKLQNIPKRKSGKRSKLK